MRIQFWRTAVILTSILAMLLFYVTWWFQVINDPDQHHGADFIAFYTAGRVAQDYGYSATYEIDLQKNIQNEIRGKNTDNVLLYNHLPYFVPLLAWIVDGNFLASYTRWLLILFSIFLIATYFLIQSLYDNEALITQLMLGGGAITFLPLFFSLWQGQDTAFLYFGLILWCVGMLKENDWLATGGLALVTVRPHLCIALAAPLIFKHRNVLWKFIVFSGLAGIYSLLLIRVKGVIGFLNLLKISAQGEWFGMNPQNMPNLTGLIYRVFHSIDHNTASLAGWIIFAIGIILIAFLWFRADSVQEPLLGLSILIAAIFAPHLHIHDLTILILPMIFAIHDQNPDGFPSQTIILLPAVSFAFLVGLLVNSLYFIVPYVVFVALAWRLVIQHKHNPSGFPKTI